MAEGSARILVVDDEHWGDSGYRDPRTIDVHIRRPSERPEPDRAPRPTSARSRSPTPIGSIRILLDNALTHTPQGTEISVMTARGDGTAGLVVSDTGLGIDRGSRARVLELPAASPVAQA